MCVQICLYGKLSKHAMPNDSDVLIECSYMPAWRTKQELNIMQEVDVFMSVMNIG